MAASLSLVVLYPNGHRQVFQVNSNTSIFQILEDACKKQRLDPAEYDLYHHERPLSHSLPVSFTNLPNHAELELRAAARVQRRTAAASSAVDICLQLESGERLMAQFPASASLLDVVSRWPDKIDVQDTAQKMDLVCVYMRKEIVGIEQLRETTLQNLGLTSGRAAIRLLHRPKGCVVQQAHVSRHFAVPFKKEENPPAARSVSPTRTTRPTSPKQARATTPCSDMATSPTRPGSAPPQDVDMASPTSGQSPVRGDNAADHKVRFSPPPASTKTAAQTVREEDIIYIGERKAVLFNLEHCPPFVPEDLGDSFYEVTIEDAKYLFADYKRQREALENRPLETKQLREQRYERLAKHYPVVLIRIYFPDRFVLQGTFLAEERVSDVLQFVRGFLRDGNMDFHLYTSPPKQVLDPQETLAEANLVPASVVHFGGVMTPGVPLLRDDILGMVSTPGGATAAATRLRSDLKLDVRSQTTATVPRQRSPDNRSSSARSPPKSPPKSPTRSPTKSPTKSPPKSPPGSQKRFAAKDDQPKTPKWFIMGKK
ncbi:tether containing UBX domain for GLUT4 isoform X1 [Dermacentor albipictus]|uniref:tether containing UBX domain for GLUT4 isoform X1 n=1 Tax=Dermacentor albipictus TaxID=60249 RepID=UPI0031FC184F